MAHPGTRFFDLYVVAVMSVVTHGELGPAHQPNTPHTPLALTTTAAIPDSYYCMNVLVILSYVLTRTRFLSNHANLANSKFSSFGELHKMERQALTLLTVALPLKFYRRVSLDGFFVDLFFYCKSAMALVLWYMDYRWVLISADVR
jgi:hypothetical protein